MLTIPLPYINFRFHRRIIITIMGITISVMFVISSFIVVNSLYTSTGTLLDKFKKGHAIVYNGDSLSQSRLDVSIFGTNDEYVVGILIEASINGSQPVYVVGVHNPWWSDGSKWICDLNLSDDEIRIGKNMDIPAKNGTAVLSTDKSSVQRRINGTFTSRLFPDSWAICSLSTARQLKTKLGDNEYSFAIFRNINQNVTSIVERESLNINEMPNAITFYAEGTKQIERNLWLVVAISSVIITILIYTTMSMELMERKRDIGVIRGIGAGSSTIFVIFLAQTIIIAGLGGLLGCFIGVIASYSVISLGVHLGYKTLFIIGISPYLVGTALLITFISSLVGGIYPIIRATRITVTECMA